MAEYRKVAVSPLTFRSWHGVRVNQCERLAANLLLANSVCAATVQHPTQLRCDIVASVSLLSDTQNDITQYPNKHFHATHQHVYLLRVGLVHVYHGKGFIQRQFAIFHFIMRQIHCQQPRTFS